MAIKNRMNIVGLFVIDEFGVIEAILGETFVENVEQLVTESERLKLICLSGIDANNDTFFNDLQVEKILKDEINVLQKNSAISVHLLSMIEKGAKLVQKEAGFTYLKITLLSKTVFYEC